MLYPDIAFAVAEQIAAGRFERGILLCGTGIGMAICANKVPGVRAAQAQDTYSAERARKSNGAQILTMGARVVGALNPSIPPPRSGSSSLSRLNVQPRRDM